MQSQGFCGERNSILYYNLKIGTHFWDKSMKIPNLLPVRGNDNDFVMYKKFLYQLALASRHAALQCTLNI